LRRHRLATRTIGKDGEYASAHDLDIYRKVIEINLVGTFNVCRLAATAMSHNTPTSTACVARSSTPHRWPQKTARSVKSPTPPPRVGWWPDVATGSRHRANRRTSQLHPAGLIDTPIYGTGPQSDEFKARLGAGVLFPKRLGYSEEFASLAVELLANSYMNAESIRIDAGIRMQPK